MSATKLTALGRSPSLSTLFDNLDSFAETPEGVAKLRALVLDLAVQGKLVEQDENDEPASELRKTIHSKRKQVATDNGIRNGEPFAPVSHDETPFDLPTNWEWIRLGEVGVFFGGGTPSKQNAKYWEGDIPWVSPKDMKRPRIDDAIDHVSPEGVANSSAKMIPKDSLLMVVWGMILIHSFPVAISACELTINQDMKALALALPEMGEFLLRTCGGSKLRMLEIVQRSSHGTCRLSTEDVANFPIPLPPLSEQRRIVAKVDGLMLLCDELESRNAERVRLRDRASRSCLERLVSAGVQPSGCNDQAKACTPREDLSSAWQRLSDHFELLYACPETLTHLRQSILQLAVQGKLVPQDPNDEPAAELLASIDETRAELVATKQLKKSKPFADIDESATPFTIPNSWRWVRIGQTARLVEYGTSQKASENENGVPVLRMNNIQDGCVILDRLKYVPETLDELPNLYLKTDDLLFNRTNSYELVGKTGIFKGPSDKFTFASYLIRLRPFGGVCHEYVNMAMYAAYYRMTQIEPELTQQCGQANFNGTKMKNSLMPLPPSAEQKRIVAKVDQLLSQCDEFSARLRDRQSTTEQLLTATIHELLNRVT